MKYSINYGAYGLERQERVLLRLLDVEYILIWKPAWGFEEDHGLRQKKKKWYGDNLTLKEIWISI